MSFAISPTRIRSPRKFPEEPLISNRDTFEADSAKQRYKHLKKRSAEQVKLARYKENSEKRKEDLKLEKLQSLSEKHEAINSFRESRKIALENVRNKQQAEKSKRAHTMRLQRLSGQQKRLDAKEDEYKGFLYKRAMNSTFGKHCKRYSETIGTLIDVYDNKITKKSHIALLNWNYEKPKTARSKSRRRDRLRNKSYNHV